MQSVIDGKVYDTKKAEVIAEFLCKTYYKTGKGNYFVVEEDAMRRKEIVAITEEVAKREIGRSGVEVFKKAFPDVEVEEA